MDEKAAYEIIIAEKLEQLSVPDKVDAIWVRIEAMLDSEMPTGDGPGGPPPAPSSGGFLKVQRMAVIFIAALIATIYFINKKPTIQTNPVNTPYDSATTIIDQPSGTDNKPPPVRVAPGRQQQIETDSNVASQPPLSLPVGTDSLLYKESNEPVPVLPDNAVTEAPADPIVMPQADTTKKKGRGVKGITDNDYRIVPDKDSVP